MTKIKAVLFDLDGTLVDTFESIVISFNESLKVLNEGPAKRDFLIKSIGAPHEVTLKKIAPHASTEQIDRATDVFGKTRAEVTDKYTKILPGVPELLKNLKTRNIKTGIVTTTARPMTEHILKVAKLSDFIDIIVTRDDVKNLKPHPEPITKAVQKLNLNKIQCIMVGDHPNDIIAAKSAGVKVVAIPNFYKRSILEKYEPEYIFDRILALKSII